MVDGKQKIKTMNIDIEKLREELIDFYGTAMVGPFPQAIIELTKVEKASPEELIKIAKQNNINLDNYIEEDTDNKIKRLK